MRLCAAAVLLLALLGAPATAWPRKSDKSPEAELSRWVKRQGGRLVRLTPHRAPAWLLSHVHCGSCDAAAVHGMHQCGTKPVHALRRLSLPLLKLSPLPLSTSPQRGFGLGQACPTCLRGVVASRDLQAGDAILEMPFEAVLRLK